MSPAKFCCWLELEGFAVCGFSIVDSPPFLTSLKLAYSPGNEIGAELGEVELMLQGSVKESAKRREYSIKHNFITS
jgi:hypothetical protein